MLANYDETGMCYTKKVWQSFCHRFTLHSHFWSYGYFTELQSCLYSSLLDLTTFLSYKTRANRHRLLNTHHTTPPSWQTNRHPPNV